MRKSLHVTMLSIAILGAAALEAKTRGRANAERPREISTKSGSTHVIGQMLRSGMDMSWLFEPAVIEHVVPSEKNLLEANTMLSLARIARARGLGARPDVRAALDAADTIIFAEAGRRSLIDAIHVSDATVAARIAANPGRYDEYNLSHIFIAVGETSAGITRTDPEALALLQKLRERILRGESFAAVANASSEDRSTASSGGQLSSLLGVTMNPAFLRDVARLPDGGLSQPVKGPEGYHLIRLEQRIPASVSSARFWVEHDIVKEKLPEELSRALLSLKRK